MTRRNPQDLLAFQVTNNTRTKRDRRKERQASNVAQARDHERLLAQRTPKEDHEKPRPPEAKRAKLAIPDKTQAPLSEPSVRGQSKKETTRSRKRKADPGVQQQTKHEVAPDGK